MTQLKTRAPLIYYGWYVLVAAFVVYTIGHGLQFSFGVFLKPLSEGFQWSRSLTAGAFMLFMICRGVSSIVMGGLTDRYGPRWIVGFGGFLMGMGMILGSIISRVWELYVFYGILTGVGMGVVSVPLSATVSRWFVVRRGFAQGIIACGSSVANLIISPVAGYFILSFGLSRAYLMMGSGSLILIILSAIVLRKEPAEIGLRPYGLHGGARLGNQGDHPKSDRKAEVDWNTFEALHSRTFWLLVAVAFILGICYYMLITNIVAYATDRGVPMATGPYLLSIIGGSTTLGYLGLSLVTDRISARLTLIWCLVIQMILMFWLPRVSGLISFYFFAVFFGLSIAGLILPMLIIPPEFFGLKSLGSILGIVLLIHILGGAMGSELGNVIYDLTRPHSYGPAFFIGGVLYILGLILALVMKKPTHPSSVSS